MSTFLQNWMMLRAMSGPRGPKEYIPFADPAVEAICVANFSSDGIGVTMQDAAAVTSQQFRGKFAENTQIISFEEFQYFTGVDTLYEEDGFYGCTNLASLILPDSIRTLNWACLVCPSLAGTFIIPAYVSWLTRGVADGTVALTNLIGLPSSIDVFFLSSGNGTGILYLKNFNVQYRYITADYKHILIDGNLTFTAVDWVFQGGSVESIRIRGDYTSTQDSAIYYGGTLAFVELMGQINGGYLAWNGYRSGAILHLGYNGVAGTSARCGASEANITTIYVGSGESQAADQAVLNQYLADPDWAQYASKLDLWYNYNGDYKNWPTIPTT